MPYVKGKIVTPRDYQERIVAYLNGVGDDCFTAQDCADATGVPFANVQTSLRGRRLRGELEGERVDGVWFHAVKSEPKIMMESPGLVAELIWDTLKDAGVTEELTRAEILRRIEAKHRKRFLAASISNCLCVWYRLGHLRREGKRGKYRYRLTDAARQLFERPVIPWVYPSAPVST